MHCCEHEIRPLPPTIYQYSITIPGTIKPVVVLGTDACVESGGLCVFNSDAMILALAHGAWTSMNASPILPAEVSRRTRDWSAHFSEVAVANAATDEPCSGDYDGL